MELQQLDADFSVCKIIDTAGVDFSHKFVFLSKTDEEISLVCESDHIPADVITCESGWKALKICGTLDFNLVGVIARLSGILAQAQISVFVISTYNTDYVLLKADQLDRAVQLLREGGDIIL